MDESQEPMEVDTSVDYDNESMILNAPVNELNTANVVAQEIRYENRGGTFATGIDVFSEEEKLKMEERAKRFGLSEKLKTATKDSESEIYSTMGVTDQVDNGQNLRLNVLHMRGTEEMSTKDVFKYFEDYAPASIEWINDVSCNVVWFDNITAARALVGLSNKIEGLGERVRADKNDVSETSNFDGDNNMANEDCVVEVISDNSPKGTEKNENSIHVQDIKCPLPPGLWRKGRDCPKSKCILLRFATRADKKHHNAEKMSDYYKKYGNPNFSGIKGILTESRKRMYKELKHSKNKTVFDPHAETNSDKRQTKNPWGSLSQNWGVNDFMESYVPRETTSKNPEGSSVKKRLGLKAAAKTESIESEESANSAESESEDDWCKRSKVMRMRMHADDEEMKVQKRRLQMQTKAAVNAPQHSNDLRSRLIATRRAPKVFANSIKVVVTNDQRDSPASPSFDVTVSEEEVEVYVQEEGEEEEEGEIVEVESEPTSDEWVENKEESDNEDDDSEESEKEVQGPRGSVIKVVQHKPRVASTVWARLNNKNPTETEVVKQRRPTEGDLRQTLRGSLRSRLGKPTRGRSPLRIEVKNDKYGKNENDSE